MTALPLVDRRVVVLRAEGERDAVAEALTARGAIASTVVIATVRDRPDEALLEGLGELDAYRWLAVTSRHAARRLGLVAPTWPATTRIAAVGPATAAIVEGLGLEVAAIAADGTASSLADAIDGGPVLFLAANDARRDLPDALARRGIECATVVAYELAPVAIEGDAAARVLAADVLVAMSPTAIDAVAGLLGGSRGSVTALVAIGPTTAARASACGVPVARTAAARDPDAVADAVSDVLGPAAGSGRVDRHR